MCLKGLRFSTVLIVIAICVLSGVQGVAGEKGQIAQIVDHFLSPEGQRQFWFASAVNFVSSLVLIIYSGQWDNLIGSPEDWCTEGTELWEFRWGMYDYFNTFGVASMVAMGEGAGITGDWGLAYLFGEMGATIGSFAPCLADQADPLAKVALILGVPPITSAFLSFYGFYSHADLSGVVD